VKWLQQIKILSSATANEMIANLKAINMYPFGLIQDRKAGYHHPKHSVNPRPILLVHGIVHNRSAFHSLRRRLEKMGWHNIYTINYTTSYGSLPNMVGQLSKRVEEVMAITNAKQIDIVAHSLGGVVARYYMSIGEGRGKVKELMTLGSPHNGTNLSRVLSFLPGSSLGWDLREDSYLLRVMNETSLPKGSRLTNIYSPLDWTLWPKTNCVIQGSPKSSFKNIRVDSVGHTGFLYSQQVLDIITSTITETSSVEASAI
jgi:triacylglycerol lipase